MQNGDALQKNKKRQAVSLAPQAKYDTACTIDKRFQRHWQPLKGISIKNIQYMFPNCPTLPIQKYINLNGLPNKKFRPCACGVIETACTISAFENRSYLGEFEAEFKKALARNQGSWGYVL
jgi:hypothetical protein